MAEVRTLGVVLGNGRVPVAEQHSPMLLPIEQVLGEGTLQTRRLFRAWILFATVLLSLSALFVIPAAMAGGAGGEVLTSRTVARFLVGHIFFSLVLASTAFVVVLWILAALWLEASRFPVLPTWIGFWLTVSGSLLAAVGTFGTWGEPVLTEFVPVVVEPAFLSGLALFMVGVVVTTGCFIYAVTRAEITRMALAPYGMLCTAAMMVATGLALVATITRLFGDWFAFQLAWRTPHVLFQAIFWGPAHLIQFAVIGAMVVSWVLLLPRPGLGARAEFWSRIAFVIQVVFTAATLTALYALDPLALPKMTTLNILVSDAQALPALFLAFLIVPAALRGGWGSGSSALLLSILLFVEGLVIALVGIRQSNPAWVPSHYQAMVPGAVLLAFMGVTTELIPLLGRQPPSRLVATVQTYAYGGGILVVSLGMLWAALLGGERRGYFITIQATGPAVLLWAGSIAAGVGVLAFALNTGCALLRAPSPPAMARVGESRGSA